MEFFGTVAKMKWCGWGGKEGKLFRICLKGSFFQWKSMVFEIWRLKEDCCEGLLKAMRKLNLNSLNIFHF